jgi:ribosomal protein S6E (S10)
MITFWLSFVDPKTRKPKGICLVDVPDGSTIEDAVKKAWKLKINPGGEVMGFPMVGKGPAEEHRIRQEIIKLGKNKLIGAAQMKTMGYLTQREMEMN